MLVGEEDTMTPRPLPRRRPAIAGASGPSSRGRPSVEPRTAWRLRRRPCAIPRPSVKNVSCYDDPHEADVDSPVSFLGSAGALVARGAGPLHRIRPRPTSEAIHAPFDGLDLYVRDGLVYYRASGGARAVRRLISASLADTAVDSSSREDGSPLGSTPTTRSYEDVIEHYPIPGPAADTRRTASGRYPEPSRGFSIASDKTDDARSDRADHARRA